MKTLEELLGEVIASEELKAAFIAAAKENKVGEFLKAQGCEATEAEAVEFLKAKRNAEGEVADMELEDVSGGCSSFEACLSVVTLGTGCVAYAIASSLEEKPSEGWGDGQLMCYH